MVSWLLLLWKLCISTWIVKQVKINLLLYSNCNAIPQGFQIDNSLSLENRCTHTFLSIEGCDQAMEYKE